MANRRFYQFQYSLEPKVVNLFLKATIGSTGAITISSADSKGVASIAYQSAAGKYKITLADSYNQLLMLKHVVQNAAGICVSNDLGILTTGTNVAASGGGTLMIQFSAAGVAAQLASGDVLFIQVTLGDSSI